MSNILLTGGSGLIGTRLTELLVDHGYSVAHLGRRGGTQPTIATKFFWDIENNTIDEKAVPWADHIIHLAGETVGQRWTTLAKQRILRSRVDSTALLIAQLKGSDHRLKSFISASAIGYYGGDTNDRLLTEASPAGEDFLATVATAWEKAVDGATPFAERVVKLRIGVVLAEKGGALAKMTMPVRLGVGAALGSGKQWLSWIHLDDLCTMFLWALEHPVNGPYNAVGPNPVTNMDFMKILAEQLKKPLFMPKVPAFILKLVLGEMSALVLGSNKAEPAAFQKEGFTFEFESLATALKSLT
jgi:uncharacterized protein